MKHFYILVAFLVFNLTNLKAQTTVNTPDLVFETYFIQNGLDTGIPFDGQVIIADISTITSMDLSQFTGIVNLTGIEFFTSLTNLNISNLTNLINLDVSNLTALETLNVTDSGLQNLVVDNTVLTELDLSSLSSLTIFSALNINTLSCIEVADATAANTGTGIYTNWQKDVTISYSEDCSATLNVNNFETVNVTMYPNPVKDQLHIKLDTASLLKSVEVYNINSQLVLKSENTTINMNTLKSGMYLVRIATNKNVVTKKVMKL